MAEQAPKKVGGARPGSGRKPLFGEPVERSTITMLPEDFDFARQLGNGNLSAGMRECVALARASLPDNG